MDPYRVFGIAFWWVVIGLFMSGVLWLVRRYAPRHEQLLFHTSVWTLMGQGLRRLLRVRPPA
jgi:hypothetical protein